MQRAFTSLFSTLPLAIFSCLVPLTAQAQIVPDNSLGEESSVVVPFDEQGVAADVIDGGAARGANLFHSFQEFNVNPDRSAFFNNPEGINNIFSRITGANISNINGLLGVLGDANLFLINPNGIVFGENAALNIQGSFFASSADSLLFDNNFEFNASNRGAPPLLEVSIPIGLNFRDNPGDIINQSPSLGILPLQTLTFVGGNVNFDGGVAFAPGANIEIGGLTEAGIVNINEDHSLTFPENVARGDISIANNSIVFTSGEDRGSVNIYGRNFSLTNGSNITGGIGVEIGSVDAQAGDIIIDATNNVLIDAGELGLETTIRNSIFGTGNGGNIEITAQNISLFNGGNLDITNLGQGDMGNITLTARENITFSGTGTITRSGIQNFFNSTEASGNIGTIDVTAQNLFISDGGQIASLVSGDTNGANINLNIVDALEIKGFGIIQDTPFTSQISSQVFDGVGDSGEININTQSLSLTENGQISTSISGSGNGGEIDIDASNIVINGLGNDNFTPSSISSVTLGSLTNSGELEANAGNIAIDTNSLLINNLGSINTEASGIGDGGSVTINATNFVEANNGSILTDILSNAVGDGGDVFIETARLNLTNGALISANVLGTGDAGNITIDAKDSATVSDSIIQGNIFPEASGNGGSIAINTSELNLTNDAFISVSIFGTGDAGDITFNVDNAIAASGNSFVIANILLDGVGNGGNINVNTTDLSITEDALFATSSVGQGNAGNIEIAATNTVLLNNGLINSNIGNSSGIAASGNVGNIQIEAREIVFRNTGQIQAGLFSNSSGDAGNVTLTAQDSISFDGSNTGIFINNEADSIGDASNAQLFAPTITLNNGGTVFAINEGQGNGGNVTIVADNLTLNRDNQIAGSTVLGTGGIINLQIAEDLILRGENEISAQAFNDANGGNLTIDTDFIIAFSGNSDIIASADRGSGGNINITAESLFGIADRPLNLFTNDINASSEFGLQGNIAINTPEVDPTSGLINLPASVGDASDQISQNPCQQGVGSQFIVTGKGGLPPSVNEALNSESAQVGLIEPLPQPLSYEERGEGLGEEREATVGKNRDRANGSKTLEVLPAMGWVFNNKGEVTLTAYSTSRNSIQRSGQKYQNTCQSRIAH